MNLNERFWLWARRKLAMSDIQHSLEYSGQQTEASTPGIHDGADYSMPVVLPQHLREHLEKTRQLDNWMEAAARDTFRFQFDTPQRGDSDMPFLPTTEDPLREWDWATRVRVLSSCHSVYQRNPLANSIVQYTADFSKGEGFSLQCHNTQVEEILEDFICHKDNAIREYERQAFIDLQTDGELFIRLFTGKGEASGQIIAVPLRPWECVWIETEPGFFRRPITYRFQRYVQSGDAPNYSATEQEDIPADDILHVKINAHASELRGRPDLYRLLPWLRADKEFLENRARQNHWRNALLWLVRVIGGNAAQVGAVRSRWARPPTPGSVAIEGGNVEVTPLNSGVGASDAMEDGKALKNRVIMGARLAEYMFADGSDSNLATATAQQLPALTKFSAFQALMIEQLWYPLFKRVLQTAIDNGDLPEQVEEQDSDGDTVYEPIETEADVSEADMMPGMPMAGMQQDEPPKPKPRKVKMIDTLEAFTVTYAPLITDDIGQLTTALASHEDREWASKETIQNKLGYDPTAEQKRIDREKESANMRQMQGQEPVPPDDLAALMKQATDRAKPNKPQPANEMPYENDKQAEPA